MQQKQVEELWQERLNLLKRFYFVGMHILSDNESVDSPRLSHKWKELDEIWDRFLAMEPDLQDAPPPASKDMRDELLAQAKANAALYQRLADHCRKLQQEIKEVLPNLRNQKKYTESEADTSSSLRVKT